MSREPGRSRKPKWEKWSLMPHAKLWELVALSLDIEPTKLATDDRSWMGGSGFPHDEGPEFDNRLEVARARSSELDVVKLNALSSYTCEYRLDSFARFAKKCAWSMPTEFSSLAGKDSGEEELRRWIDKDLWSEADLSALCCGLVPQSSRPRTAELSEAEEDIRRAILAKALPVICPTDANAADKLYGRARFFVPKAAAIWAEKKFPQFPFASSDFASEDGASPQGAPRWPSHDTQKLTALRMAAVRFWSNYDQSDSSTAHKNEEVSEWLQTQYKGLIEKTLADSMATILRADGLKPGPRKKS